MVQLDSGGRNIPCQTDNIVRSIPIHIGNGNVSDNYRSGIALGLHLAYILRMHALLPLFFQHLERALFSAPSIFRCGFPSELFVARILHFSFPLVLFVLLLSVLFSSFLIVSPPLFCVRVFAEKKKIKINHHSKIDVIYLLSSCLLCNCLIMQLFMC